MLDDGSLRKFGGGGGGGGGGGAAVLINALSVIGVGVVRSAFLTTVSSPEAGGGGGGGGGARSCDVLDVEGRGGGGTDGGTLRESRSKDRQLEELESF